MSRYTKLPGKKGIYKDSKTGNYYCQKRVNKKLYSETFKSIVQAAKWVKEFHPERNPIGKIRADKTLELNGAKAILFREAWKTYKRYTYPMLEKSTVEQKEKRSKFFLPLMGLDMREINGETVSSLIFQSRELALSDPKSRRFNFNKEIEDLAAVFNWYHETMDLRFQNPIAKKRHKAMGKLKDPVKKDKPTLEETKRFFDAMWEINKEDGLFAMLAEIQFMIAGRVQEAAAISPRQVDLSRDILTIDQAISWARHESGEHYLKKTKTGATRHCQITAKMKHHFIFLKNRLPKGCEFLFNLNGKMLTYRQIQRAYNNGLKRAGLDHKYGSTHILRHSMATATRNEFGIEHTQAIGGWSDLKVAHSYGSLDISKQAEAARRIEEKLQLLP